MTEGYCVKCKASQTILNGVEDRLRNGRKCIRGKCPSCGTSMFKIVGAAFVATAENSVTSPNQVASG
ncbi:MAG: DUF5679 domain-containing protein [Limisphaerales bacterium]